MMRQVTELEDEPLIRKQPASYVPYVPFILLLNAFLCGSFYGWNSIAQTFLVGTLGFTTDKGAALVSAFFFINYACALLGGFLADAYLGFFRLLAGGVTFIVISLFLLTNVAVLQPYYSTTLLLPFAVTAITMFIVGYGVAKPGLSAFMGDQFREDESAERSKWFAWFYLSIQIGSIGFSLATPMTLHFLPLWITFAIILLPSVLGLASFLIPSAHYRKRVPGTNIFARFLGIVLTGLVRPRGYGEPHWADKAKRFGYSEQEVEDSKAVLSVLTIFIPLPFFWAVFFQMYSVWVIQASKMNLNLWGFPLPPGETTVLNGLIDIALIPIFEKIVYPLCARCFNFTPLKRIGVGHVFTIAALIAAGLVSLQVERYPNQISVVWIIPQYILISCGEILLSISGLELAYKEAPASMKGMVTAVFMSTTAVGNLFISIFALLNQFELWVKDLALAVIIFLVLILFTVIARSYQYKPQTDD